MKIVLKCWLRNKWACMMAVCAGLVYVSYNLLTTRLLVVINDALSDPHHIDEQVVVVLWYSILIFISACVSRICRKFSLYETYVSNCNALADKVLDSDINLFVKHSCSYVHMIQSAITQLCQAGWSIINLLINIFAVIIPIITAIEIGGTVIIPVISIYTLVILLSRIIYPIYDKLSIQVAKITRVRDQELENMIYGFMEVRSFRTEEKHRTRIRELNESRNILSRKKAKLAMFINGGFEIVDDLAVIAALIVTSKMILSGEIAISDGFTIVMLMLRIINPLVSVLDFMDEFSECTKHAKDYETVMDFEDPTPSGNLEISKFESSIELKNVYFSYENASNTLENISIKIKKGEKIGICGESGGGKTTLFKLLNKFYKPQKGVILLDGIDIWEVSNDSYRKFIGSVHQENTMFPGTILENVVYGSENVPESQIIEVCKKAHIYDFIMSLPHKFNTEIGPRGLRLSTGQKQRIALARLLLIDPEIIMLDEATSALDNESERFIQDAIDSLSGKTIITIAHRLSTIWNCDQIYVIGDHNVIEHGTHEELMEKMGVYYTMNKQKK